MCGCYEEKREPWPAPQMLIEDTITDRMQDVTYYMECGFNPERARQIVDSIANSKQKH